MVIAKYRKEGYPGEWFLTDFTMEQVEGRVVYLERMVSELPRLMIRNQHMANKLIRIVQLILPTQDVLLNKIKEIAMEQLPEGDF